MSAIAFKNHREAALALLSDCKVPRKAAGFLGNVCVTDTISQKQRRWLVDLLDSYGLPSLAP